MTTSSRPADYRRTLPSQAQETVLRSMLEQQRTFRIEQLDQLDGPGASGPLGTADLEIRRALAAGARAALHDVQNALWRMDEGRYGLCTECGEPVGIERLEVLPQVALCMTCQRSAPAA